MPPALLIFIHVKLLNKKIQFEIIEYLKSDLRFEELKDIINIQLSDNVKARILDNELSNMYVDSYDSKQVRSQIETYNYLLKKKNTKY